MEGAGEEVSGQSGGHGDRKESLCGETESTWGPGPAVSPERGSETDGPPSPELKPLFGDDLGPEPGSRAADVHRVFEESYKAGWSRAPRVLEQFSVVCAPQRAGSIRAVGTGQALRGTHTAMRVTLTRSPGSLCGW